MQDISRGCLVDFCFSKEVTCSDSTIIKKLKNNGYEILLSLCLSFETKCLSWISLFDLWQWSFPATEMFNTDTGKPWSLVLRVQNMKIAGNSRNHFLYRNEELSACFTSECKGQVSTFAFVCGCCCTYDGWRQYGATVCDLFLHRTLGYPVHNVFK